MSDAVFVIQNQLGQFWTRSGEWADGREPQRLLKLKHHDEAVNQLVELSAKDIDLRGEILACEVNAKNEPEVAVSDHTTPTLAETAQAARATAANEDAGQGGTDIQEPDTAERGPATQDDNVEEPPVSAAV
jgi:hypothetical protein